MLGCQVYATTPIWLNPPRYIGCHNFDCNIVLSDTNFTKNNFYSLMCYLISGNVEDVRDDWQLFPIISKCQQVYLWKEFALIICLSYDTKDSSHSLHAVLFIFPFLCACLFMCACTLRTFSSTWICACWHWVSSSTVPHLTFWRYSFIVLGAQRLSRQVG